MTTTFKFYHHLNQLEQKNNIIAEYIWIDGTGLNLRAKARTIVNKTKIESLKELSEWNYDGSSTYQATTENSEVTLVPVAFYDDPFRGAPNVIVMCSAYMWSDGKFETKFPANTNFRHFAEQIFEASKEHKPWFGIEQEYTLLEKCNKFTKWPLGWPAEGFPEK